MDRFGKDKELYHLAIMTDSGKMFGYEFNGSKYQEDAVEEFHRKIIDWTRFDISVEFYKIKEKVKFPLYENTISEHIALGILKENDISGKD